MSVKEWFFEKVGKISFKKDFFTKKRIIILGAVVLIIALLCFFLFGRGKKNTEAETSYVETQAYIGNITESIEQSGVVEPYERYEITSLVRGEIISSPFEEGDFVNEGDTVYQIDDEDVQLTMEKAQNSIEKAQMSLDEINDDIEKLNIYATASGKLTDFSLELDDNVNGGIIGKIINNETLTVDIPFSVSDFEKISVGDGVTITSALYMTSLPGKVTHKYYANAGNGTDGSVLKNIEIELQNPGALAENTTFAATVHTSSGNVNSAGSGTIGSGTVTDLKAEVSGTVTQVAVKNGDYVTKGQLIARLSNPSLVNSQKSSALNLRDSQLSMESNQKTLDNYNITAPISGTIITKNSKAGDNIDSSNSQTVMMVIADMSKMKFTISVDELDISDIHLGQTAIVDADALPSEVFEATVTTIASEGVSSGDGVTTYDIELTIDEPGNLKSGMNVNANILINEAYDVVVIPEDALMSVRGTSATVLVKTDGTSDKSDSPSSAENASQRPRDAENNKIPQRPEDAANVEMPERPEGTDGGGRPERAEGLENAERSERQGGIGGAMPSGAGANIPEGCEMRQVVIGISDGTNIEIVSGLSEGETVVYIPSTTSTQGGFMFGRMMGGGMPGGMMSGGMPSGGGNRGGGTQQGNRR